MSDKMALAAILIAAVCTFLLRALPFVAFAGERKLPLSLSAINGGITPCSAFFWARLPICSFSDFCKLKTISVVLSTAMHLVECYNEPTNERCARAAQKWRLQCRQSGLFVGAGHAVSVAEFQS